MSPVCYPTRRPDVETHILPDGTSLLFDPVTNMGHVLNTAGSLVWDYCDGTLTGEQIADELASLQPDDPEMRAVTHELLDTLDRTGLLLAQPAPSNAQG